MKPWIAACLAMATGVTASLVVSRRSAEEPSAAANHSEARLVPVADPHAAMDQQRIARLEHVRAAR